MPREVDKKRPLTEEELLDLVNNLSEIEDLSDDPDDFEENVLSDDPNYDFADVSGTGNDRCFTLVFLFVNYFLLKIPHSPFSHVP